MVGLLIPPGTTFCDGVVAEGAAEGPGGGAVTVTGGTELCGIAAPEDAGDAGADCARAPEPLRTAMNSAAGMEAMSFPRAEIRSPRPKVLNIVSPHDPTIQVSLFTVHAPQDCGAEILY